MSVRILYIVFALLAMFLGFCTGMLIGSFFTSEKEGFAGPAIAFWFGLIGLVISLISSILLIRTLKARSFQIALVIVIGLSIVFSSWIVYRIKSTKTQHGSALNIWYEDNNIKTGLTHFHPW